MDLILLKKTIIGMFEILVAGSFVYLALQAKWSFGDGVYYPLALACVIAGLALAYSRG